MKKKLIYAFILIVYEFIATILGIKCFSGDKASIIISLIAFFMLYVLTIYLMERNNIIIKTSKKAQAMFNYFDVDAVKELISKKKTKGDRFEAFRADDQNQKVTVLTIKILNNDAIKSLDDEKRIRTFGKLLEVIETNIEKRYGLIYNIKDDLITVLFNTVYVLETPELEAIKAALNINIDLMKVRKENIYLSQTRLDYSICNEEMDFYIRDKRVLVNGEFKLSEELVNISGEDSIYIPENIFKKYMNQFDYDYLGKFYFSFGDVKVYKIIKIINENEIYENTYKESQIKLKKGGENKLKKFAIEKDMTNRKLHEDKILNKFN